MKQYIDIVKHVLENGKEKSPVRKNHQTGKLEPVDGGVKTLACPNVVFSHDMSEGFPLLTTKKMAWRSIRVELEGFIKGITDKQWYKDRKCNIWNEWANPEVVQKRIDELLPEYEDHAQYMGDADVVNIDLMVERKKDIQEEENDLGPIYGYQWRNFDQHYPVTWDDYGSVYGKCEWANRIADDWEVNGVQYGTDQLKNIVQTLQENPMDRRMVCSAWNPNQAHMQALPPCHTQWGCTVIGDELHLRWDQRSCDLMLGVPFNIASYALLQSLLCEVGGFKPGNLTGILADCHIYENQLDAAREQITRTPGRLPRLHIIMDDKDIFNWVWQNATVENYHPQDKIDFGKVTV